MEPLDTAAVTNRLARAGFIEPESEAFELVSAARNRRDLATLLSRRLSGEPLEWILGTAVFAGRRLVVQGGVYVPRPQTEELARRAAQVLGSGQRAADLCTGSGAVACYLQTAVPGASVVGVDLDPRAVACAARNNVAALLGDLGEPLRGGSFDLVTAVVPYVPTEHLAFLPRDVTAFEPRLALDGGAGGTVVLAAAISSAARILRRGGHLFIELGGDQDVRLGPHLCQQGFEDLATWYDEEGDLRGLQARFWRSH